MQTDLVQTTRTLLKSSEQPMTEIAKGAGVSIRWLYMFESGEIRNPTLRTIQGLHTYLSSVGVSSRRSSRANA